MISLVSQSCISKRSAQLHTKSSPAPMSMTLPAIKVLAKEGGRMLLVLADSFIVDVRLLFNR